MKNEVNFEKKIETEIAMEHPKEESTGRWI